MDYKIEKYFSSNIDNKNLKILEFVELIGKYLTKNENSIREKAIILLSSVIQSISVKTLHSKQIYVITRFFCGCLDDESSIKEILLSLYSLQKMDFFDDDQTVFLCTELFKKFNSENNIQSIRYIVFQILNDLIIKHQGALKKIESEFIEGFIKIIGREKDPRNLILVFSIMNIIISEFDITFYAKDIFNLLFCYFPITFKPSSNEVLGVTVQDLKLLLKKCMSANDILSSYSIPSLIDKYDFSPINTKKDIIDMLSFCIEIYSPHIIKMYDIQIWNMLKSEIFDRSDESLIKESLDCLFIISRILSKEILEVSKDTSLLKFLKPISDEINKNFEEPDTKVAKNSIKVLYSLSSSSKYAFEILSKSCVSNLLTKFQEETSTNTKAAILEFISFILLAGLHVYGSSEKKTPETVPNDSILIEEKSRLFNILCDSLTESFLSNKYIKASSIHALLTLSEIHNFLQYNELELIVQYFNEVIIKEDDLRAEALEALVKIAETKPNLILEITFPNFLKLLSEADSITSDNFQILDEVILTTLSHLCVEKQLFDVFIFHLLEKFDNITSVNNKNILRGRTLMFALLLAIRKNFTREKIDIGSYIDQLLPELFTRVINSCIHSTENIITDFKIINIISQIANFIVRSSSLEKQKVFVDDLINLFINGNSNLLFLSKNILTLKTFKPFKKDSNLCQKKILPIFVSSFAGIRRECLPLDLKFNFIETATNLILENHLEDQQQIFLFRFICLIYNKFDNESEFSSCEVLLKNISKNDFSKKKIIILYIFWIIKALILKIDKYGYTLLDKLIDLMNDKHLGEFISYNFEIIANEDELINKENFAFIRLLYKQFLFYYILNKLTKIINFTTSGNTPKQIILPELASILPLLLQCSFLDNHKLKVSNINILYIIILESPDLVSEYFGSIVPFLLTLITEKHNNHVDVRIAALRCLGLFPTILKAEFIQPFKNEIIHKLSKALDDPKKSIRIEAGKTKHRWHSMI
ncbi:hypothetical protein PORY_000429 [Pneumocystis oryctolagi]|uniref:Uncharacterized protein n=1 Tax=Pneumocystis oryctolagi TaxID=42067 RepID=A0ACB7CFI3_9ASCO|nr:hypothetical protein PORY_000429 [Pneumocystis oryctolagi]